MSDVVLQSLRERYACCCLNIWKNVSFHESLLNWCCVIYAAILRCDYLLPRLCVISFDCIFVFALCSCAVSVIGLAAIVPAHNRLELLLCRLLSQAFSPWYFYWTIADSPRSDFQFHTAVLSVLCVMFQVQLSFVVKSIECLPGTASGFFFKTFVTIPVAPFIAWGTLLVVQLVEALRYKPEGREFDSRWCHWNISLT